MLHNIISTLSMFSNGALHCQQIHNLHTSLEKKRKYYAVRRQLNEKPSIILGCPGPHKATVCNVIVRLSSTHLCELHSHELLNSPQLNSTHLNSPW